MRQKLPERTCITGTLFLVALSGTCASIVLGAAGVFALGGTLTPGQLGSGDAFGAGLVGSAIASQCPYSLARDHSHFACAPHAKD